jgi:diguanylate cyclase (GGDEF)-like protein/PAS domain S-box-containing protein
MQRAGESSGPTRGGEAIAPLRGLLELSRLTRSQPTLLQTLHAVASTVSEGLEFATVVINTYHAESDEYEVVVVQGADRARDVLLGHVTKGDTWTPLLDDRFRTHGVYFIPEGVLEPDLTVTWYTPELSTPVTDAESWHPDDALFAILEGADGRRYGTISIDEPATGLRPSDEVLEIFGALAAHASLLMESSRQVAELNSALARNRAVITSALDCVIAVDEADRLIEFNPAAERTFDYRAEDVLGRDATELLVPPEARPLYRESAARIRRNASSSLLDRRIETTAIRSDGSEFPIELTLTRVEGIAGEGPVFYGFIRDIAERRRGEEQLAYLAYHDGLTGLPNRMLVEQELDLALARARRGNGAAALMFVDLDDFKEVNDSLGHAAGDRLLAAVATRLRRVLRDSDVLARQGGDEFLVLLADLSDDPVAAAERVGSKLLDALREPFVVAGTEVRTGASIGVSVYPADASDTEALMRHADVAMAPGVPPALGDARLAPVEHHRPAAQRHRPGRDGAALPAGVVPERGAGHLRPGGAAALATSGSGVAHRRRVHEPRLSEHCGRRPHELDPGRLLPPGARVAGPGSGAHRRHQRLAPAAGRSGICRPVHRRDRPAGHGFFSLRRRAHRVGLVG